MTHHPNRPTIDFSGPSRQTARDYAADLPSRVIDERHNKTLQRVQFGATDVDALALNEALTAAMRSGATRFGQSMARRDFTREVAHLAHITQAVLENAVDQLPTYDTAGVRSRKVEELEEKLLQESLERAGLVESLDARDALLAEAEKSLSRAANEIEALERMVDHASTGQADRIERLEQERDNIASVLGYVFDYLDEATQARVLGFWDAIEPEYEHECE